MRNIGGKMRKKYTEYEMCLLIITERRGEDYSEDLSNEVDRRMRDQHKKKK